MTTSRRGSPPPFPVPLDQQPQPTHEPTTARRTGAAPKAAPPSERTSGRTSERTSGPPSVLPSAPATTGSAPAAPSGRTSGPPSAAPSVPPSGGTRQALSRVRPPLRKRATKAPLAASAPQPSLSSHGGAIVQPPFLPMTKAEMQTLGWKELDVLFITGDAYVDHPAFGVALLGRWLVHHGFRVGIVAQPNWNTIDDISRMGRPRLYAGITAGSIDSQLAHYTAFRKKRHDDSYTPGGEAGARPNRASVVYANLTRRAFPQLPIVLGGIEASLRRISHYDFWTDALRRSILLDAKADLILYGMGERGVLETAQRCAAQSPLTHIAGSVWIDTPEAYDSISHAGLPMALPPHEDMESDASLLMDATLTLERHVHRADVYAVQPVGKRLLILAPPAAPLSTAEMDLLYSLPFARASHPSYSQPIPAEEMLRTSITSHRGCGGGCSFCSLALHQGRRLASRSEDSILDEAQRMSSQPKFSGSISDVGGPTANMWQGHCALNPATCRRVSCCHPKVCKSFITPQRKHVQLLRTIADMPKIKHVRVASGIRADLALSDEDAMRAYTLEFTGGQLKVAPEHCSPDVLELMRKPDLDIFERFLTAFQDNCRVQNRQQFVIPYLMSAFPGCTDTHMRDLARWLAARHWTPQQVQCFIPTPGTVATAMYYCGIDPHGNEITVARTDAERLRQHRILMPTFGTPTGGQTPVARRLAAKGTKNPAYKAAQPASARPDTRPNSPSKGKPNTPQSQAAKNSKAGPKPTAKPTSKPIKPATPNKPSKPAKPTKPAGRVPEFPDFSRPNRRKG